MFMKNSINIYGSLIKNNNNINNNHLGYNMMKNVNIEHLDPKRNPVKPFNSNNFILLR